MVIAEGLRVTAEKDGTYIHSNYMASKVAENLQAEEGDESVAVNVAAAGP